MSLRCKHSEIIVDRLHAAFFGDLQKVGSGNDLFTCRARILDTVEGNLLDFACLGRGVVGQAQFVALADIIIGDIDGLGNVFGLEPQQHKGSELRRGKRPLVFVVECLLLRFSRLGHRADVTLHQSEVLRRPGFGLLLDDCADHGLRHSQGLIDEARHVSAQNGFLLQGNERGLGQTVLMQHALKTLAVELALRVLERRIVGNLLRNGLRRHRKAQTVDLAVQSGITNQLSQHLAVNVQVARLFGGQLLADLPGQGVDALQERVLKLLGRYLFFAHDDQCVATVSGEDIVDTPHRKAEREHTNEYLGDPTADTITQYR